MANSKKKVQEQKEEVCNNELVEVKIIENGNAETEEDTQKEQSKESQDKAQKEQSKEKQEKAINIYKDLENLAMLLNTTVDCLKKEFYLIQIKKIMAKLHKTIIRYDMTEAELDRIFLSASQYGLEAITVAPAYLPTSVKQIKKNRIKMELCSIIDFPFGESSFKGKLSDVKESLRLGASSVAVAMPSMMFNADKIKELKKQCKKLCKTSRKGAGIVINASDINEENYAKAMKYINKSKLSFITLAFGDATLEEVKRKISSLSKCGIEKSLHVIANVDRVESVVELFKLNVDKVLTPYADDIGTDLLKRFGLI